MKTKNLISTLGLALVLTGCGQNIVPSPNSSYESQSISTEGKTPIEKLDRNSLVNARGFDVDFNADGKIDFVCMRDNRVYFGKGIENGRIESEIQIAHVGVPVVAYSIRAAQGELPYLVFFDQNDNGYKQENLGSDINGIPILGDITLEAK